MKRGASEIDKAEWTSDGYSLVLAVKDRKGLNAKAYLTPRPTYCDRGHIQLIIEGYFDLDWADSFPRYFFSFEEADTHTRDFLKWRIWKEAGSLNLATVSGMVHRIKKVKPNEET